MNENIFNINWVVLTRKVGAGVTAIRRRSQRALKLDPDLELIDGDVVVLIGTAAAVVAGERILLQGET